MISQSQNKTGKNVEINKKDRENMRKQQGHID